MKKYICFFALIFVVSLVSEKVSALGYPTISYLSPSEAKPGEQITVYGTNLYGNILVINGQTAQSWQYNSSADSSGNTLVFSAPQDVGSYQIQVEQRIVGGLSNSVNLNVQSPAPTIYRIEPASAQVGTTVYVYGSNFNNATFVGIDGASGTAIQPTDINLISSSKLSFVVPSLSIGSHTIGVAEKAGPYDLSSPLSLNIISEKQTTINNINTSINTQTNTITSLDQQKTIEQLLAQIYALQSQLVQLQSAGNTNAQNVETPFNSNSNSNSNICIALSNNLSYRSRDSYTNGEVSALQDFLQSKGYLNSEPTGYFGLLTLQAVKKFQMANGIAPAEGFVGPATRSKLSIVSGCGSGQSYNNVTPNNINSVIIDAIVQTMNNSLENSKKKGYDAKIKAQLSGLRAAALLYWDANGRNYGSSVNGNCSSGMFGSKELLPYTTLSNYPEGTTMVCNSNTSTYAVSASLSSSNDHWCASEWSNQAISGPLASGAVTCGDNVSRSNKNSNSTLPKITVLYPNGGEILKDFTPASITWTSNIPQLENIRGFDVILKAVNSGNTFIIRLNHTYPYMTDTYVLDWLVDGQHQVQKDTLFLVQVCKSDNKDICDESDRPFTINP